LRKKSRTFTRNHRSQASTKGGKKRRRECGRQMASRRKKSKKVVGCLLEESRNKETMVGRGLEHRGT